MAFDLSSLFSNPNFKRMGSEMLQDFGYGLTQAPTFGDAFGAAAQQSQRMQPQRDAFAQQQEAEAKRQDQINQTAQYLREQGAEDLASAVEGGMMSGGDAFSTWYQQAHAQPDLTADMQNYQFAQANPGFASFIGGGQKPTSSMQEYEYARGQGYEGTFQEYETAMKQAGATSIDFNQNQGVAAGFADRMAAANQVLGDPKVLPAQTDPIQGAAGAVPGIGNYLTSPERQMADQAQRDFVNAILRRESGAAIAPSEFENASKQYFPQPGDSPEVIQQKAANRKIAIEGVMRAAGPSYQQPPSFSGGVVDFSTYFGGQ